MDQSVPVVAPNNGLHDVDHYKCYRAKIPSGTPKYFPSKFVLAAADEFEDRLYDIKKPSRVCNPVDVGGQGIKDSTLKHVCYKIRQAKGQTRDTPHLAIHVADEFGDGLFDTKKAEELCVASR
jgi:hypothetical protein